MFGEYKAWTRTRQHFCDFLTEKWRAEIRQFDEYSHWKIQIESHFLAEFCLVLNELRQLGHRPVRITEALLGASHVLVLDPDKVLSQRLSYRKNRVFYLYKTCIPSMNYIQNIGCRCLNILTFSFDAFMAVVMQYII